MKNPIVRHANPKLAHWGPASWEDFTDSVAAKLSAPPVKKPEWITKLRADLEALGFNTLDVPKRGILFEMYHMNSNTIVSIRTSVVDSSCKSPDSIVRAVIAEYIKQLVP